MIQPVLRMGDPRLLRVAQPVREFGSPGLEALVADMLETMRDLDGAGLAAPQVGIDLRLVVFEVVSNRRYPQAQPVPLTVLANPVIEPLGDDCSEDWEGCLSVPGLRGLVPRYNKIRYRGFTAAGEPIDRTVSGFHARVVQHECDHLDGILFPRRIGDLRYFGFCEEVEALRALL